MAAHYANLGVFGRRKFLRDLARVGQETPPTDFFFAHRACKINMAWPQDYFMWQLANSDVGRDFLALQVDPNGRLLIDGSEIKYPRDILQEQNIGAYLFNTTWHPGESQLSLSQRTLIHVKERLMYRIACLYMLGGDALNKSRLQLADYSVLNRGILSTQIFPQLQDSTIRLSWDSVLE